MTFHCSLLRESQDNSESPGIAIFHAIREEEVAPVSGTDTTRFNVVSGNVSRQDLCLI